MSPFRDAPPVELGPLTVGLSAAASRAIAALPTGGRLIIASRPQLAAHLAGALGSTGLVGFLIWAVIARSSRWSPHTLADLGLGALAILLGGGSLAAVMLGLDRNRRPLTRSGEEVRRDARAVLDRLVAVASRGERIPHALTKPDLASLTRALASAGTLERAPWIPDDVRGRAELLLARTIAALAGHAWADDEARRDRVRALLTSAAAKLADPAPALEDLAALDGAPRGPRLRVVADPIALHEARDDHEDDDAAPAPTHRVLR
jgi:hypothetical protein